MSLIEKYACHESRTYVLHAGSRLMFIGIRVSGPCVLSRMGTCQAPTVTRISFTTSPHFFFYLVSCILHLLYMAFLLYYLIISSLSWV